MSADPSSHDPGGPDPDQDPDPERIAAWLAETVDPSATSVHVTKLAGGHSSGAWRIDLGPEGHVRALVLKAPELPSIVHRRDAGREARILDALHRMGGPVPAVLAIDDAGVVVGRPCFAMELVEGRSVPDAELAGCHGDGWFREAGPETQLAIWESFHDALAALHGVDPAKVPDAHLGRAG